MPYTITKPDGPGKVQRVDPTSAKEGTLWAAGAKDQRLPAGPGGERRRRLLRELKDVADSSSSSSISTSSSSVEKNASAGGESAATGPRRLVIPLIAQLTGYDKTEHAKKHNIKQAFVPFLPSDCDPPGTSSLKGR
jgi:hypothetical protein